MSPVRSWRLVVNRHLTESDASVHATYDLYLIYSEADPDLSLHVEQ